MLKSYDTECEDCGLIIEQYVEDNGQFNRCPTCDGVMNRIFSSMNFKLLYNPKKDRVSWGDFNYATSQYWSKVKEQREQGYDVKAVDEN